MPAEASSSGAPSSGSTRSPNGVVTCRSSPSKTLSYRKFDTSPAGATAPSGVVVARIRLTVMRQSPCDGALVRLYWRIWRAPSGSTTPTERYWPGRKAGSGAPSSEVRTNETVSADWCRRSATRTVRHTSPGATPAALYRSSSSLMRVLAISQYSSSQAAATSGVTASPRTSTMASNRCLWTIQYSSGLMPREACLCAMRDRMASTRAGSGSSCRVANAAMEPARAFCCSPCFWLPRLNRFRSSSGCAANIFL